MMVLTYRRIFTFLMSEDVPHAYAAEVVILNSQCTAYAGLRWYVLLPFVR